MILLRKGGELAVFITPGFGASYCVKRDRVSPRNSVPLGIQNIWGAKL